MTTKLQTAATFLQIIGAESGLQIQPDAHVNPPLGADTNKKNTVKYTVHLRASGGMTGCIILPAPYLMPAPEIHVPSQVQE